MIEFPSKCELISDWNSSAVSGNLLIPKHDPNQLSTTYTNYRTVLSYDLADSLMTFLNSNSFTVRCFQDNNPSHGDSYYEIIPSDPQYSIPASGVPAGSPDPNTVCDRIVAVSGARLGWHMFGENAVNIQNKVAAGELTFGCEYDC